MSFPQHMGASEPQPQSLLKDYDIIARDYVVDEEGNYSRLQVQCPSCDGIFWVDEDWWCRTVYSVIKKDLVLIGRSCCYCYKTAKIPDNYKETI